MNLIEIATSDKTGECELVEKFLQEAVLMRDFDNPYVLSLIGISFETDGSPMVVLPFMENGYLQTLIRDPDRVGNCTFVYVLLYQYGSIFKIFPVSRSLAICCIYCKYIFNCDIKKIQ